MTPTSISVNSRVTVVQASHFEVVIRVQLSGLSVKSLCTTQTASPAVGRESRRFRICTEAARQISFIRKQQRNSISSVRTCGSSLLGSRSELSPREVNVECCAMLSCGIDPDLPTMSLRNLPDDEQSQTYAAHIATHMRTTLHRLE